MIEFKLRQHRQQMKRPLSTLRVSIPLRVLNSNADGVNLFEGRLETIGDGRAQICLDKPLPVGTKIDVLVELKDRQDREIRFRYEGKVASEVIRQWYQLEVSFKEGGGISGKDAHEILADLFPASTNGHSDN